MVPFELSLLLIASLLEEFASVTLERYNMQCC